MLFTTALWFMFKVLPSDCLVLFSVKVGKGASGVSCKTDEEWDDKYCKISTMQILYKLAEGFVCVYY